MNKTKISWTEYTWNPVVGCKNHCWYCYAERINNRFNNSDFESIQYHTERLTEPLKIKKPSKIFVVSMGDLFGSWVMPEFIKWVLDIVKRCPQHTFQFLTKNPARYIEFEFSSNCWLGVTITKETDKSNIARNYPLPKCRCAYISYEPLLGYINKIPTWVNWVILGAYTGPGSKKHQPKKEWIDSIVKQCKHYKIPIFMKSSLKDIWDKPLIQEFPE